MSDAYTRTKLDDVEDVAAKHGMGEGYSARFPREALGCVDTGFSVQRLDPGTRAPIAHRHDDAEEVYVILTGGGEMLLGEETITVAARDAIRVSPGVVRSFAAGDDGLELLVFGPRHEGDGEIVKDAWPG